LLRRGQDAEPDARHLTLRVRVHLEGGAVGGKAEVAGKGVGERERNDAAVLL
jgi:hypothetical protein